MGYGVWRTAQQQQKKATAFWGGLLGILVCGAFTLPVEAAQLRLWRFDTLQNRLEFSTDDVVRPRVQLIPDPVRLVVDLPGVKLGRPPTVQTYSTAIRAVRLGQFDPQTARIVVELAPGYTVDPSQVKVTGTSPQSWAIELPTPQRWQDTAATTPNLSAAALTPSPSAATSATPTVAATPTQSSGANILNDVLVTSDGLFLRTQRGVSDVKLERSRNQRKIEINVPGVTVAPQLTQNDYKMNFHGVSRISVRQQSAQPPVAQITLNVDRKAPDWMASTSRFGGVVLLPKGGSAAIPKGKRPASTLSVISGQAVAENTSGTTAPAGTEQLATVEQVSLGGSQLLIRANRPVYYTTGWERSNYRITVRGAQLSSATRAPQTGTGSALSAVMFRQDGPDASILAKPASGVRIAGVSRVDAQTIVLNLSRYGAATPNPTQSQVNIPAQPSFPSSTAAAPIGRRTIVIDPGHGGPDPGAIGIGGLRETNVVLPISQEVVRILQQQGMQVYITRNDESREVDLPPRVALAEQVRADVFVSIHANAISMSRPDVNGLETYYAPGSSSGAQLARVIHNSILRNLNVRDRSVRSARFYVVRRTSMPAVLVETGFVTGAEDAPRLRDPAWQRQLAAAIAQGIMEFLRGR